MAKIAIVTDSNSGITQNEAKELGITVIPMPFNIGEETYYEDITLSQEQFYEYLKSDVDICTSQPAPADVMKVWDELLKEYDEIVHMPMSSGLSGSCQTAIMLSEDYDGKVCVVNNQRISVTLRQAIFDTMLLIDKGYSAKEIQKILEEDGLNASIYIMLDTLYYLKKGGRITPAAAALGTLLKLKPVLQIQGEKLDAFAKARTVSQAKSIMINAIKSDINTRFGGNPEDCCIFMAHTNSDDVINEFKQEILKEFPDREIIVDPLSLSVSCHIGPGALAVAIVKKLHV
ncbi:MAG: DegV family protein [Lachnospiraceae bacterium]|nr:DegV family protein [Lachnospiraceae bacterium]